ncbi:MAG: helix-turn-helix domain-containing protein [Planctomycetota bacterium]
MDTNEQTRHVNYEQPGCPVEATLELIGGKWKGIILYYLLEGRLRFGELNRRIGCVTERMLIKQLKELEQCGLVKRTAYAEIPPRVEYELTSVGVTLGPVLAALKTWGETYALPLLGEKSASGSAGQTSA